MHCKFQLGVRGQENPSVVLLVGLGGDGRRESTLALNKGWKLQPRVKGENNGARKFSSLGTKARTRSGPGHAPSFSLLLGSLGFTSSYCSNKEESRPGETSPPELLLHPGGRIPGSHPETGWAMLLVQHPRRGHLSFVLRPRTPQVVLSPATGISKEGPPGQLMLPCSHTPKLRAERRNHPDPASS